MNNNENIFKNKETSLQETINQLFNKNKKNTCIFAKLSLLNIVSFNV